MLTDITVRGYMPKPILKGTTIEPSTKMTCELCPKKDDTIRILTERCAGQAEVLGRRAEKTAGDPRFHAILKEMGDLHNKKMQDYGQKGDPFANVRSSKNWGVPPWVGAMIRLNDKIQRLQSFTQNGSLANEGVEDSLIDIANYAAISLVLFREETQVDLGSVQ